jgi:hypothetical protein
VHWLMSALGHKRTLPHSIMSSARASIACLVLIQAIHHHELPQRAVSTNAEGFVTPFTYSVAIGCYSCYGCSFKKGAIVQSKNIELRVRSEHFAVPYVRFGS